MNFLTCSVVKAEASREDFAEVQLSHIRAFRKANPPGAAGCRRGWW